MPETAKNNLGIKATKLFWANLDRTEIFDEKNWKLFDEDYYEAQKPNVDKNGFSMPSVQEYWWYTEA